MLDEQDGATVRADAVEHAEQVAAADRIEVGGRLVQEEHVGLERQQPRDREPLLLAAGERRRVAALEAREPDGLERGLDARRHVGGGHAELLEAEDDLLRDVGREELRLEVLEHHADAAGELADRRTHDRCAAEADLAAHLRRREARHEAREAAHEGRLAGARRSHDDGQAAGREAQRHAVERGERSAGIAAREVDRLDGRRHRSAHPSATTARKGMSPIPISPAPLPTRAGAHAGCHRPLAIR